MSKAVPLNKVVVLLWYGTPPPYWGGVLYLLYLLYLLYSKTRGRHKQRELRLSEDLDETFPLVRRTVIFTEPVIKKSALHLSERVFYTLSYLVPGIR